MDKADNVMPTGLSNQITSYYDVAFKAAFTITDTKTDKNGLYRIVWRCSYCTLMSLGAAAILSVSVSALVSVSVDAP